MASGPPRAKTFIVTVLPETTFSKSSPNENTAPLVYPDDGAPLKSPATSATLSSVADRVAAEYFLSKSAPLIDTVNDAGSSGAISVAPLDPELSRKSGALGGRGSLFWSVSGFSQAEQAKTRAIIKYFTSNSFPKGHWMFIANPDSINDIPHIWCELIGENLKTVKCAVIEFSHSAQCDC